MPDHSYLSKPGKKSPDKRDPGKFLNVMYRTHPGGTGDPEAGAEKSDEQRRIEDLKLAEEFEIQIEDLKHEAIKQFDKELYDECIGTFRFLCELDPNNQVFRDYRELCEKLTGRTVSNPSKQTNSSGYKVQPAGSLDGLGTADELAGRLSTGKSAGEMKEKPSSKLIAGYETFRSENGTSAEKSDKREILEIPDYDICPPNGGPTNIRGTRFLRVRGILKGVFQLRPKPYKLFLSIAGILVLAAILGLPLRVHRRQDFPGPAPGQPIDPNGSQSRQETGTSPSQTGTFNSLQGKAEENRTPERYAHPSDNNVIPNSNPALKVDPQDKKASELKVRNAVAQAKDLALAGKSVDARKAFSSLLERARHEDSFPLSPQVLEEEIKKLEVVSYPVIHDHFLGSCKGILQFNSYTITYEPSGEGHHRFNSSLAEIRLGEPSSKLKIFVGRRTYQFKSGSGTSIEDKRQKLRTIYQAITSRSKGNPE